MEVTSSFSKRYHNSFPLVSKLSKNERILLDFILEKMDEENLIKNDTYFKNDFNGTLVSISQPTIKNRTINNYFSKLLSLEILTKWGKEKGNYQVSPVFFHNGNQESRERLIRKNLEKPIKFLTDRYRAIALSKKGPDET